MNASHDINAQKDSVFTSEKANFEVLEAKPAESVIRTPEVYVEAASQSKV